MHAKRLTFAAALFLCARLATAAEPTPAELQKQIEGLPPAKVAWREIAWKTCLLDGLKEARAQKKPLLLWIFIDRPCDDARC
jgi:hypothetical protein